MSNLMLITSVINTPNKPLSYTNTRSVYSREKRFQQTKNTIETVKQKIPNCQIIIVECSDLTDEENEYLKGNCDHVLNLWEKEELRNKIFSNSKSWGEGTQTIFSLKYIKEKQIKFENFFKISGRYWINKQFCFDNFNNKNLVCKKDRYGTPYTFLYKLHYSQIEPWLNFLISHESDMIKCIGFESLFNKFLSNFQNVSVVKRLNVSGYISVSGYLLKV